MTKDPQGQKWHLTVNNPLEKGFTHERIKSDLCKLQSAIYWCMADEKGTEEETPHTHIFIVFSSAVRFSTIKKLFESAHIERVKGTAQENRDYIAKEGKWKETDKAKTNIAGTFEEWGEMPIERQRGWNVETVILERIQDGATNAEILREFPNYLRGMRDVEFVRQALRAEESRDKWRDLKVIYIWGKTGTGKTRSVMDGHGYSNVYAVNNYKHPFDGYIGENVMLFDEFSSDIRIQDMNNYLDGYPIALPARYSNKQACYERVYIISNLDLREQYKSEQQHQPEVWAAFVRRIHKVIRFNADGSRTEYETAAYMSNGNPIQNMVEVGNVNSMPVHPLFQGAVQLPDDYPTPFDAEDVEHLPVK
jgi:hypothetical protein